MYLVTDMFNTVNAIFKADGRSRKTKIVDLCKLKRCFRKQPVVAINSREQSVNESSLISNSFDPASPAPNQKGERGRMACTNANTNGSNDEETVYQPLDQVTQIERDENSMTVDGHDSGTTVSRLVSIGRRRNKENVQLELSRETASAEPPKHWQILQDLTNRTSKVKNMSIIEE